MHYPYSTWFGWVNWFVAICTIGSGVAFSVRPQLCNMYIALTAGSIWNVYCTGGSFDVHVRHR